MNAENQMEEGMKAKVSNFRVMDTPKTISGTGKLKKMTTAKQNQLSTPSALSSSMAPVPSSLLAVQSPVVSEPSSSPGKKKMKMDKEKTNEPSGPTAIPTSPTLSVSSPSPPSIFLQTKKMTKGGIGMGMSKDRPTLDVPTDTPSATPIPSNAIPSTSPVPSNNVPISSRGMGHMM